MRRSPLAPSIRPLAVVPPLLTVDQLESGFYAVFLMLLGVALIGYGHHRHRERRLMADTATSEVESAAVGAVELVGTVEPAERTIDPPLTDAACVVVRYEVEEYTVRDGLDREWVTVAGGVVAEPFYLDDGTGRILVDPSGRRADYDLSTANRTRDRYDAGDEPPESVARFLAAHTDESPQARHDRRYTQDVLPVGAEAYVFGDAEPAAEVSTPVDPASALVVTEDADTELFLISDKSAADLVGGRRFSLVLLGAAGIAVFSAGLWLFLSSLTA